MLHYHLGLMSNSAATAAPPNSLLGSRSSVFGSKINSSGNDLTLKLQPRPALNGNSNKLRVFARKEKPSPKASTNVAPSSIPQVKPSKQLIDAPFPPVRGVNLGGWLLAEGWITPWLFDGMVNDDLRDGNKVTLKSAKENKFLVTKDGGGGPIIALESVPSDASTMDTDSFSLWRVSDTTFQFRTQSKVILDSPMLPPVTVGILPESPFVGLDAKVNGGLVATATKPGKTETFEIKRNPRDKNRIRIKATTTGLFIQVKADGSVTADYSSDTLWKDDDPSVFLLTVGSEMEGEFQLVNGLGAKASKVMQDHWNSYIVEDDFKFMAKNGINSVRIPVGYWIAYDNPPFPFVAGSLAALDNAFDWGEKHHVRIIIDLHAVPGNANASSHGGSRDASLAFGFTDESINESVHVLSFLAERYAQRRNLLAIQVINEPTAPLITVEILEKYYQKAYDAIREHSPSCYIIFSTRFFGPDDSEFLEIASRLPRTALDVHNYHVNWPTFMGWTAQQNIDYVKNVRPGLIKQINPEDGRPLLYIGEWTGQWSVQGATEEEYQEFAAAQVEVYNSATFGWTYWTFKNPINYWSMEWMIKHGYINLVD